MDLNQEYFIKPGGGEIDVLDKDTAEYKPFGVHLIVNNKCQDKPLYQKKDINQLSNKTIYVGIPITKSGSKSIKLMTINDINAYTRLKKLGFINQASVKPILIIMDLIQHNLPKDKNIIYKSVKFGNNEISSINSIIETEGDLYVNQIIHNNLHASVYPQNTRIVYKKDGLYSVLERNNRSELVNKNELDSAEYTILHEYSPEIAYDKSFYFRVHLSPFMIYYEADNPNAVDGKELATKITMKDETIKYVDVDAFMIEDQEFSKRKPFIKNLLKLPADNLPYYLGDVLLYDVDVGAKEVNIMNKDYSLMRLILFNVNTREVKSSNLKLVWEYRENNVNDLKIEFRTNSNDKTESLYSISFLKVNPNFEHELVVDIEYKRKIEVEEEVVML